MPKYVTEAWVGDDTFRQSHYLNDNAGSRTMAVVDEDAAPVRTGLLNQHGVPLYRLPDKVKCGFGR